MSSASAEDIFCMKRGVGNAKCEVVVSPSAMIKRRVAAANALRTLAVIPHPLGPSTRTAQKYGKGKFSGESPRTMRYERWRSSHILWAPRPELLRNMVKGNLAASRRINPGARRRCGRGIPAGRRKRLPCCTFPRTSVPCRWAGWCQRRTHSRRGRPCPPEDTPYIYPPWP